MDCFDLNLALDSGATQTIIHPAVVKLNNSYLLCDCGYPGQSKQFLQAFEHLGIPPAAIRAIIITHHDYDHIGSLAQLKNELKNSIVISSEIEAPYISGEFAPLRLSQALKLRDPQAQPGADPSDGFIEYFRSIESCHVDMMLPFEEMMLESGIRIIPTPGHTAGHISLYLEETATLIAGDLLAYVDGKLELANPHYAENLPAYLNSVAKTKELPMKRVLCYHGGWFEGDYQAATQELLAQWHATT